MQHIASEGITVLVPPDGGLRKGARPGWTGGLYDSMRRVLATPEAARSTASARSRSSRCADRSTSTARSNASNVVAEPPPAANGDCDHAQHPQAPPPPTRGHYAPDNGPAGRPALPRNAVEVRRHPAREVAEDLAPLVVHAEQPRRAGEADRLEVHEQGVDERRMRAGRAADGVADADDARSQTSTAQRQLVCGAARGHAGEHRPHPPLRRLLSGAGRGGLPGRAHWWIVLPSASAKSPRPRAIPPLRRGPLAGVEGRAGGVVSPRQRLVDPARRVRATLVIMDVELLYFDGCPSHEAFLPRLRELLAQAGAGVAVEQGRVESDAAASASASWAHRRCGSKAPTLIPAPAIAPTTG